MWNDGDALFYAGNYLMIMDEIVALIDRELANRGQAERGIHGKDPRPNERRMLRERAAKAAACLTATSSLNALEQNGPPRGTVLLLASGAACAVTRCRAGTFLPRDFVGL